MEVRIGVIYTTRELVVETDESPENIAKAVEDAIGGSPMLWLNDTKGKRVGIPSDKIAFVEVAADAGSKQVGFGPR